MKNIVSTNSGLSYRFLVWLISPWNKKLVYWKVFLWSLCLNFSLMLVVDKCSSFNLVAIPMICCSAKLASSDDPMIRCFSEYSHCAGSVATCQLRNVKLDLSGSIYFLEIYCNGIHFFLKFQASESRTISDKFLVQLMISVLYHQKIYLLFLKECGQLYVILEQWHLHHIWIPTRSCRRKNYKWFHLLYHHIIMSTQHKKKALWKFYITTLQMWW